MQSQGMTFHAECNPRIWEDATHNIAAMVGEG